jgi:glycopeptide antibiotics resistance protein
MMIEALQTFSPVRTASIIDVTTDTIGALAGAATVALAVGGTARRRASRSYLGIPVGLLAGPYLLAVISEALTPLLQSMPFNLDGGPVGRLLTMWSYATLPTLRDFPVTDILLMAPVGFLGVMWVRERGWSSSNMWLAVGAAESLATTAAQIAHGAAGLPIHTSAIVADLAGVMAGAWAAHRWLAPMSRQLRGVARARWVILAYATLLLLWGWRPFMPKLNIEMIAAQLDAGRFIPLRALAERVDLFGVAHTAQQFLLYVPLGALIAVWPLRTAGWGSTAWPAVALALAIELGHIVINERNFDVTSALLAAAGVGVGSMIVRRAGFRSYGALLPRH